MAQLARFSPAVVEVQQKAGLDREDMEATMGELKLLREKVRTVIEKFRGSHMPPINVFRG